MVRHEYLRKALHITFGTAVIALYYLVPIAELTRILFILLILALTADFLIADFKLLIPVYKEFERPKEREGIHEGTFYLIGMILAFIFFPKPISITANMMMVYGDFTAWALRGKKEHLITFLVCTLAGIFATNNIIISTAMAAATVLVEKNFMKVSDNLAIPLFSGLAGYATVQVLTFL
ncbi:hypothetical protein D6825_00415 [Candidatus Woesearchaeota archaeon]|nr:MAG: hypothetical protein D6825_00415 [Candidatus Woesearchaeota archaeon]